LTRRGRKRVVKTWLADSGTGASASRGAGAVAGAGADSCGVAAVVVDVAP